MAKGKIRSKEKSLILYFSVLAMFLPDDHFVVSTNSSVEISNAASISKPSVDGRTLTVLQGHEAQAQAVTTQVTPQELSDESKLPKFQGGTDIYHGMTEWNSLVCGLSVCNSTLARRSCSKPVCDTCHCDEDCSRYGDCCPDYYLSSPPQSPQADFSCVSQAFIVSNYVQFYSYKMVSSCPNLEFSKDDQMSTMDKCLNPDHTRIQDSIPVYSAQTKLHYRNAACAVCNGIEDTTVWNVQSVCQNFVKFFRLTSYDDLLRLIQHEETCAVHFQPPVFSKTRKCQFTANTTKTCNVSGNWRTYDPDIALACSLYSQPFLYSDVVYENIFCASCNGIQLKAESLCLASDSNFNALAPFSFILDIRQTNLPTNNKDAHINCTGSEVYDPSVKMCRPLICPLWRYPQDSRCVSVFPTSQGMGYILHFSLTPRHQPFLSVKDLKQLAQGLSEQIKCKVDWFQSKLTVSSVNVTYAILPKNLEKRVQEIDVQYSLVVGAMIPRKEAESHLVGLARSRFWWHEDDSKSPVYFDVKWQAGVSSARLFNMAAMYTNGAVKSQSFTITEFLKPVADNFKTNASLYIVVNDLLMCNMIELNSTEYTVVNSSQIFINSTGEHLDEGQYVWNGDRVRACTNYTGDIPDSQTQVSATPYDQTELILTLICTCLSLCGLAVTLLIYLVIPSVRQQLPGKNNMFLFVNLFLAQLLFLTGSSAKLSTPGCRALGIVIHYFWLATFCWKVICAYHMYRLFTSPLKVLDQTKSLYRYVLFSHLFPAVWIIGVVSINLGLSGLVRIGYGDRQNLCFLSSTLDIALAFIIPVGLVITLNTFFFSRSIYALRHRPKVQRQTTKSDIKETVVYFKMSLLFGFTWVLGLVALLVNERGMWYVFTVVNASIGVFIFVSFGAKNLSPSVLMRGRQEVHSDTTRSMQTFDTSTDIRDNVRSASVSGAAVSLNKPSDDANNRTEDNNRPFPAVH